MSDISKTIFFLNSLSNGIENAKSIGLFKKKLRDDLLLRSHFLHFSACVSKEKKNHRNLFVIQPNAKSHF